MRTKLVPGSELDIASPDEVRQIVNSLREPQKTRIRETSTLQLDNTGSGSIDVYKIPTGFEFEARRVTLNLQSASDPSTGNVPLNVAGKYVIYQRSGTFIEYAVPISPNAAPQVPGIQTWSDEQGPYLRNAEVFQVVAKGLTASVVLTIVLEGILRRPGEYEDR